MSSIHSNMQKFVLMAATINSTGFRLMVYKYEQNIVIQKQSSGGVQA